jgi:putative FmdB family regulatory protein
MPIYEFKCTKCGSISEEYAKEPTGIYYTTHCRKCGGPVKRVFHFNNHFRPTVKKELG